jgi:O-succinylbenzoic acid--CoA ligase
MTTMLSPFSLQRPWLRERAKISPNLPAVFHGTETISFRELYDRSLFRAEQLRALGIEAGDIIASILNNGLPAVEIFHAVQLCGASLLPLNMRLTDTEIAFQLYETGAKVLISVEEDLISLAHLACKNLAFPPVLATDLLNEPSIVSGEDLALHKDYDTKIPWTILYTSGTTGKPKGVPLNARHFGASGMASLDHLGMQINEKWLCCVPLFHIAGLSILTRSVLSGASVVLHDHFDAEKVSKAIDEQHITLMSLVPTMLHRLVQVRLTENKKTVSSLRAILIGGSSCSGSLWQQALDLGLPVLRTYGLTEACSQVATEPLSDRCNDTTSVARPLQGIEIRIIDTKGQPLNVNEEGEILVRGRMVMDHYHKRPEESAKAIQGGWLHTGDIGFLNEHGGLCVLNRRSDLIVSGGENIYPAEVEASLIVHPAIKEACITGEDDSEFGQRVVAWVALKKGFVTNEEELQQHCRKTLAGYKIPRKFIFIERLPRNASGKIMRQELFDLASCDFESAMFG